MGEGINSNRRGGEITGADCQRLKFTPQRRRERYDEAFYFSRLWSFASSCFRLGDNRGILCFEKETVLHVLPNNYSTLFELRIRALRVYIDFYE